MEFTEIDLVNFVLKGGKYLFLICPLSNSYLSTKEVLVVSSEFVAPQLFEVRLKYVYLT